jgi:RNA polymerase sigma factor (sigma-70 family)
LRNYKGEVCMYDEKIYINTRTGEGVGRVIKKITPLIDGMAARSHISGYSFDDIRQEICLLVVDGVKKYDPDREVKLSTFLHWHLKNKFITKLKSLNTMANDATSTKDEKIEGCPCGGDIERDLVKDAFVCSSCKKIHKAVYRSSRRELIFSEMKLGTNSDDDGGDYISYVSTDDSVFPSGYGNIASLETKIFFEKLEAVLDDKTAKILRKFCIEGTTMQEAARSVGMTGWAASVRLKRIRKNPLAKKIISATLG